jgi:hypothetical protein
VLETDVLGTDVLDTDVLVTDVLGTDVLGTDVLGTDVLGTDVLGTDVLGTDVLGTDVLGVVGSVAKAVAAPSTRPAAKVIKDFIRTSLSWVASRLFGLVVFLKSHATARAVWRPCRASRMRPTSRENSRDVGGQSGERQDW